MQVVLATGIYSPDIGGPATYARSLAQELTKRGVTVGVVTYVRRKSETDVDGLRASEWPVIHVPNSGGPFLRWWRYARALRAHAEDADVVLAFSLVSVGMPLWIWRRFWPLGSARGKPKLLLRLGGDFLWERYTDWGGNRGLREFYRASRFRFLVFRKLMGWLLQQFDHIVFSTRFQEEMYGEHYQCLPPHAVIENALPVLTHDLPPAAAGEGRTRHVPFRLLFMGRFVRFKNLPALIAVAAKMPNVALTMVGEGPLRDKLSTFHFPLSTSITFLPSVHGPDKQRIFAEHDLLALPSLTEISPNVALEARAAGLPVLLTEETGLSEELRRGMVVRKLRTAEQIREAICEVVRDYERVAREAAQPAEQRGWGVVVGEYLQLFDRVLCLSLVAPHPVPLPVGEGNLLMISGDRSLVSGKRGAFWQTLEELRKHWGRIDVLCPRAKEVSGFPSATRSGAENPSGSRATSSPRCRALGVETGPSGRFSTSAEATVGRQVSGFDNVFVHSSPHRLWYQSLWILRKGRELSRQRQYIVMTVHDYPPFYNGLGAWLLHRSRGIPWVAEIHHVVGYPAAASFAEWIGRRMYLPYLWMLGRSAAAFRVVNKGAQGLLVRWGVQQERIHLVPSFYIDHELLLSVSPLEKKWDVVFCGRMVPNKGVPNLIKALAHIPNVKLLLMGDGPRRTAYYAMAKRFIDTFDPVNSAVLWQVDALGVYQLLQRAKVFVMCSLSEGGPRVALEAMALGLPVIATRVGVMPEVIEDGVNGLFTTGDPGDIAKKIQWLLSDDRLRARMGAEAKKVLDRFEKRRLIAQYADFLKSFA